MGTMIANPWPGDRQIEELMQIQQQQAALAILDFTRGKMPTADEFLKLITELTSEMSFLHNESHENREVIAELSDKLAKLEGTHKLRQDTNALRRQSRDKAARLRAKLGLKEDPKTVDGFAKIRGLLKKYANEDEDAVEFLRKGREERQCH